MTFNPAEGFIDGEKEYIKIINDFGEDLDIEALWDNEENIYKAAQKSCKKATENYHNEGFQTVLHYIHAYMQGASHTIALKIYNRDKNIIIKDSIFLKISDFLDDGKICNYPVLSSEIKHNILKKGMPALKVSLLSNHNWIKEVDTYFQKKVFYCSSPSISEECCLENIHVIMDFLKNSDCMWDGTDWVDIFDFLMQCYLTRKNWYIFQNIGEFFGIDVSEYRDAFKPAISV